MAKNKPTISMAPLKQHLSAIALTLLLQLSVAQSDEVAIAVVAHKNSPLTALTQEEVVNLFLGKHKTQQEIVVKPLDNKDNALRERFYRATANMSAMRVKAYWSRIVFSGQGRPPREISSTEAQTVLVEEPGALTYIPENLVTDDMKIIFKIP